MEADPTRMCEKLVGLGDVDLVGDQRLGRGCTAGGGDPFPQAPAVL